MGNVGDAGLLLLFSIPVHYFCGPHFLPASVRFLSLFLLIEFLLSTVLLRASHMPRIILGARNTPLHSLEMYCLVRGLNNVQLKWGNVFIVNSSRLGEVRAVQYCNVCVCVCASVHAHSCPTLCDPMDCSLPGSSCPWDFPDKNTGVGCLFLLQLCWGRWGQHKEDG